MEEIKKYEAAVIRRVCYMVNNVEFTPDVLLKSFYFTNQLPFDKWFEENKCDSWILSSFSNLCKMLADKYAEIEEKRKVLPLCIPVFNEMIDIQNESLIYYTTDKFYYDVFLKTYTDNDVYTTYDACVRKAKENSVNPEARKPIKEQVDIKIREIRASFESEANKKFRDLGLPFEFNVTKLWTTDRYRHVTIDDFTYSNNISTRDNTLDIGEVSISSFEEYQYIYAVKEILRSIGSNDCKINALVVNETYKALKPNPNENGLPGAMWDPLQTLYEKNSAFEKDIISLVHSCAENKSADIRQSWIFKYAYVYQISMTPEEEEAQDLFIKAADSCFASKFFRTVAALAICTKADFTYGLLKSMGGNEEPPATLADSLINFGVFESDFDYYKGEYLEKEKHQFIIDIIAIMKDDKLDLDTTGMEQYIGKERNITGNTAKSGGCYVATCVYGSYDCPQVWTLRRYRDYTLAQTWYGRAFIHIYYAISPILVKCFGKTKLFKKMWKGKLDRMVAKLQKNGVESTPYEDKKW